MTQKQDQSHKCRTLGHNRAKKFFSDALFSGQGKKFEKVPLQNSMLYWFHKIFLQKLSLGNDLPYKIESMRSSGEPGNCTRPGTQYPGTWALIVPCPGDLPNPGNVSSLAPT